MTQLSPHFSLEELCATQIRNVDNIPPSGFVRNLTDTAQRMEAVRELLGHPIHINSGYRNETINKLVGGQPNSAHLTGRAVDFICPQFGSVRDVWNAIHDSTLEYDQLIAEFVPPSGDGGWVHISFATTLRMQAFDLPAPAKRAA